jgi:diguanylate cyclase (GGDEF)-like protein
VLLDSAGGKPARLLLVGDDPPAATSIVEMLWAVKPEGLLIIQSAHLPDAIQELAEHGDSCVLLTLPDDDDPLAPLRELTAAAPAAAIIVVSELGDEALGLEALRAGAQDHVVRSELRPERLSRAIRYATERKRAEVRLTRQALVDPLTELPNRLLFRDRLSVALDRSRRTGLAPAVMFLDVDSFKQVNDSLGHAAGDELLRVLSQRFRALLRPMDTVARIGGDEFTFLFEGLTGEDEAVAIAQRIGEAAAGPVRLGAPQGDTTVRVSIGIAMLDDPAISLEQAVGDADAAMYRAKELGGGRSELFGGGTVTPAEQSRIADQSPPDPNPLAAQLRDPDPPAVDPPAAGPPEADPPDPQVPDRQVPDPEVPDAAAALRAALYGDQLRVHYQPRVSINGQTGLVGFEALVRWQHPERGLIGPDQFMALAEDSGLIVEIGDWVLEQALAQVRRWRQSRPGVTISVNISRRQLADTGFSDRLTRALTTAGADPSVLWLEVAQDAAVGERAEAGSGAALTALRDLGVNLALDDVGLDDTSLNGLRDLPVDMLKIHQRFVASLDAPSEDRAVVGAVVELGHALGLNVVAEGVETDEQLAQLRDLGCDGAQGFLFSQPVPERSVRDLLGLN